MTDPSLLITRPTATDPGLAPPGRQLFSILAPVPNLDRGPADWTADAARTPRRSFPWPVNACCRISNPNSPR